MTLPFRGVLSRLASTITILFIIFAGTRALVRALPGDPLETLIAESGTSLPIDALRSEMGLDRPFLPALFSDLKHFAHGNLGTSLFNRQPVAPLIRQRFFRTFELITLTLTLSVVFSLIIGVPAAASPSGALDRFCSLYGSLTAALPTAWIGPLFMILFAVKIPIFPVGGHIVLPALTLSLSFSGLWARLIRERVRETLVHGSADGARARGIAEWKVRIKYGLAPASGALLAYLGTQLGALLGGVFVTEVLFDWHGMGSLLVEAVLKRDYPIIEAGAFVTASASLFGSLLGDALQIACDPRLRSQLGDGL